MEINFSNLNNHIIPISDFSLSWRFSNNSHSNLPNEDLHQLKPLSEAASTFISHYIDSVGLYDDVPFKKNFFVNTDKFSIKESDKEATKGWLNEKGFANDKQLILSWQPNVAMIVPWKLLVQYFDTFYYPVSDDLTVTDQSLEWAMLIAHWEEIYFGTNKV